MFVPELVSSLRGYTRRQALADGLAGVIVGIVALPLAIAFAIASGLSPEYGLYTAIVAGFLISALGGSRVQIGGPTGAFVVIVFGIVQEHGVAGLTVATLMAGIMLVIFGLVRLGAAIKFIPFPVTTGFTSGIALIIALQQYLPFFGLRATAEPADFIGKIRLYANISDAINVHAVLIGLLTLAILIFWPRISRRIPGPVAALVLGTLVVNVFGLSVETIGSRFGEIRFGLPQLRMPEIDPASIRPLLAPAFSIALLAAIESLLSAVVADGMIGTRHKSNAELVAQGVANIASPLLGGMPATGAIARTATNIRMGARTPVAGMVHALTLLLIGLFLGRWVVLVPMPVLAGILLMVAYHMSEWRTFLGELKGPRSDVAVMLTTFALTVLVDLTVAIQAGMVLAAFLFMRRMAEVTNVSSITSELDDAAWRPGSARATAIPQGVQVYEINGPFFFGAAEKFKDTLNDIDRRPHTLILGMRNVPAMDSTGLNALRDLVRRSRKDGTRVILAGVHAQPMMVLARSGFLDEVGDQNLAGDIDEALAQVAQQKTPADGPQVATRS
ncbi:MAG: SulP family inorganic anion transporter [Longimicrobiales bacterium]